MSNSFGDIQQPCWHSSLPKPMSQDDVARLTTKVWHPNSGPKQNIHPQCINAWNIIETSWSFWMDSWWLRLYMFSGVCSLYFVRILTSLVSQNRFGPRSHLSKSFSCFAHLAWSHAVWRVWRYKCHTKRAFYNNLPARKHSQEVQQKGNQTTKVLLSFACGPAQEKKHPVDVAGLKPPSVKSPLHKGPNMLLLLQAWQGMQQQDY